MRKFFICKKIRTPPICFRALFLGIPGTFLIDFADYWGLLVSTSKNYILAIFFHSSLPPLFFKETFPILPPKSHQTSR